MTIKEISINLLVRLMRSSFYNPNCAYQLFMMRYDDIFNNKLITFPQKLWAQKRGFLSDKISYLGLTDDNYTNYLSDFDYYQLHPINGTYSHWIDDKLTVKYLLQPFAEYLPEYYYHIYNGEILRLPDCPGGLDHSIQGIIDLLQSKCYLAAKPVSGSLGIGFYKLAYDGLNYFINDKHSSEPEIRELINTWMRTDRLEYLITEYLQAHRDLRKIWGDSPDTMRIMVIRERNHLPRIVASYIEFGRKSMGVIEGYYGINCLVDQETGGFSGGTIDIDREIEQVKYHPDTKYLLEGNIPHWKTVTEKILEISRYIPQLRYMGYDVIITDEGFKIIEINSLQGIMMIQYFYPLLKNESSKEFFNTLIQEKKARKKS